jgi:hypothetical protein
MLSIRQEYTKAPLRRGSRPPAWAALEFFIDAAKMGNL